MQIHGGYGYAEEYPVSRLFVDARVLSIFEGADETLCLKVIARRLTGLRRHLRFASRLQSLRSTIGAPRDGRRTAAALWRLRESKACAAVYVGAMTVDVRTITDDELPAWGDAMTSGLPTTTGRGLRPRLRRPELRP